MHDTKRTRRALIMFLVASMALLAGNCAPGPRETPGTTDPVQDRQAILDAHQAMVEAYQTGDTEGFLLLMEKSEDLLLYHPRVDDRWQGIEAVRRSLPMMFSRLGKSTWLDVHLAVSLNGDVGWLTSHIVIESPNFETPFTGRGTEVWVRHGDNWRLAHGHWSANPEFDRPAG